MDNVIVWLEECLNNYIEDFRRNPSVLLAQEIIRIAELIEGLRKVNNEY